MTKKKMSLFKIILLILGSLIVLAIATYNIVWKMQADYIKQFAERLESTVIGGEKSYELSENGYFYRAIDLDYLSWEINLQITKEPNELGSHDLFIWPHRFGETTFGCMIYDVPPNYDPANPEAETSKDGNSVYFNEPESLSIYFDKNGNPIFSEEDTLSYKQEAERLVSEHREEIDGLFEAAKAKWPELFE